ncbi:MAG: 4-hydroxybenzoyl-CoA reductase subunit alpha [Acidobacteria bacterium]|nr:4-hydroxybenzoyl-CoA reductase subunit alpha [Acidobacteriota bacterium]
MSQEYQKTNNTDFSVIGKSAQMIDGTAKVMGTAIYADDIKLPGMLYGKILRSPHAHARIVRIDTSRAMALLGVKAIITGKDTPVKYGILPIGQDETALAVDKVIYVGQEIAAVAAITEEIAEQALDLIDVEYELLPAYLNADAAMAATDIFIHNDRPKNIEKEYHHNFGDIEKGFAQSDLVLEDKFSFPRITHAAMEPHSAVANYDASGKLTVWTSTQTPHYVHRGLAKALQMHPSKVRVIKPFVGGGFGGKSETFSCDVCSSLLSKLTGKPVKITFTREEVFYAHRGRPDQSVHIKLGMRKDGKITSVYVKTIQDGGAFCSYGVVTILYSGALIAALYDIDNIKFDGYRVVTNKPACGPMRGHGTVNVRYSFEVMLDRLAIGLGLDPAEVRLKNMLKPNTRTVNDLRVTSYGYKECVEKATEHSGWAEKRDKLPFGRGIGIGGSHYVSGAANSIVRGRMPHSNVSIKIDIDGGVSVFTGTAEIGQGTETVQAQIVAEELGLPLERIRVIAADSDITPVDLGSYSSRVTFMAGNAALFAARDVKNQLLRHAAEVLGESPEHLICKNERIYVEYDRERSITFREALISALEHSGTVIGKGAYTPPSESQGGRFKGAGVGPGVAYSYSASVADVSVNPETGQVRVNKIWVAHDCGRALNPLAVEGQVEGSVWMGLGQALQEEQIFTPEGLTLNPSLLEYKSPGAIESPDIETIIVESIDPEGPFGAKEAGEGSLAGVIPAIANAVYDAVGVWITSLPITPEKILKELNKQKAEQKKK